MANYVIGEVRYNGDKLVEVSIQCVDEPDGPFHYECEVAPVDEVVRRIRHGDQVVAVWSGVGALPVEVVSSSANAETIEVVKRDHAAGYLLSDLPRLD